MDLPEETDLATRVVSILRPKYTGRATDREFSRSSVIGQIHARCAAEVGTSSIAGP